jgi:hypothetical protein
MTAKNTIEKLPPEHHVVRYASWNKLRKDEHDNVIGVLGVAFQRRPTEETLSVTWLEYFDGSRWQQIVDAIRAIRASALETKPKSAFAIGQVGAIKTVCESRQVKVRILHEPEPDNKAHAVVRSLPREDMELLELLAAEAWAEVVSNQDNRIPAGSQAAP